MKKLFLLICLLAAIQSLGEDLRIIPMEYTVVSDTLDPTIEKGKFLLEGDVKMFSSLSPIQQVQIGCTSSGKWVRTDSLGKFEILLDATDSVVYFYKDGWNEIVFENYEIIEQHRIQLEVYMIQDRGEGQMMLRKPVIYLYSDVEMEFELQIEPYGEFTFTYPTYQDGWQGTISNNELVIEDSKYPYLFWEAHSNPIQPLSANGNIEGYIHSTDNIVQELENHLSVLGFNSSETTDFITFWGPVLQQKDYCFIQFIVDDNYDEMIGKLTIDPTPKNSRRVFMVYELSDDSDFGFDPIAQKFNAFEREGFVLFEWGGGALNISKGL